MVSDKDQVIVSYEDLNPIQTISDTADVRLFVCGDVNCDLLINILDIVYLINYKYKEGPAPDPLESADVNRDNELNILDIVYLINYLYKNGTQLMCP